MWYSLRNAFVRPVVLWSSLQGTRRQITAAVSGLLVDLSLIQPDLQGFQAICQTHGNDAIASPSKEAVLRAREREEAADHQAEVPVQLHVEEINWWAWIAFAHTFVDALVFLPWPDVLVRLAQSLQQRVTRQV